MKPTTLGFHAILEAVDAGLLQVRSRWFYVALMIFVGVGILALAYLVPPGRPG